MDCDSFHNQVSLKWTPLGQVGHVYFGPVREMHAVNSRYNLSSRCQFKESSLYYSYLIWKILFSRMILYSLILISLNRFFHYLNHSLSVLTQYEFFVCSIFVGHGRLSISHPMALLFLSALLMATSKDSLFWTNPARLFGRYKFTWNNPFTLVGT